MIELSINGSRISLDVSPDTPLLYVLRNDLELNGPKFGCGLAQCGTCVVQADGVPLRSCVVPVSAVTGRNITTLEGLGTRDRPHPLQQAFIDEQAMQCGYCANGMIMTAEALLQRNPDSTDREIRQALDNTICRCGTHNRIVRAVKRAAEIMKADSGDA